MKIIIVEDDKVLSLLLSKMVERLNFEVLEIITKGREAISKIEAMKPDLVLMDIMLEDEVDGIDAMIALRKKSITTPVIYITGNSDPINRQRAEITNFEDYMIKPVGFEDLRNTIERVSQKES